MLYVVIIWLKSWKLLVQFRYIPKSVHMFHQNNVRELLLYETQGVE